MKWTKWLSLEWPEFPMGINPNCDNKVKNMRNTSAVEDKLHNWPVVGCFIRAVVKHLQELRATQVEHELGVQREVVCEAERVGVVLVILPKLLTLHNRAKHATEWRTQHMILLVCINRPSISNFTSQKPHSKATFYTTKAQDFQFSWSWVKGYFFWGGGGGWHVTMLIFSFKIWYLTSML